MNINEVLMGLDQLFRENRIQEIAPYLTKAYNEAEQDADYGSMLSILNELMGFCREVCQYEQAAAYGQDALLLIQKAGMEGTIPHATTMLNIANALRAGGQLEASRRFYEQVEALYGQLLAPTDFGWADLNNNISLLYQEMQEYEKALECLKKALAIAITYEDRRWEVAVSHSNLATTYMQLAKGIEEYPITSQKKDNEEVTFCVAPNDAGKSENKNIVEVDYVVLAMEHANKAIAYFRANEGMDTHYGAALTALGQAYEMRSEYGKAVACYKEAKEAIKRTLGETDFYRIVEQYETAAEVKRMEAGQDVANFESCIDDCNENGENGIEENKNNLEYEMKEKMHDDNQISGLDLCQQYYEEIGNLILQEQFPDTFSAMTIGLVGEGSDCFGYDDVISRDHDWGPGFYIFMDKALYEKIGEQVQGVYDALPNEYKGYKRLTMKQAQNRLGVKVIEDFFAPSIEDAPQYQLATLCNGRIFKEGENAFNECRQKVMAYYSASKCSLLLADAAARFSQCVQYNYDRMLSRGDTLTASMMLTDGLKEALRIGYILNRKYTPHDKWLQKGAEQFCVCTELAGKVDWILKAHHRLMVQIETDEIDLANDSIEGMNCESNDQGDVLTKVQNKAMPISKEIVLGQIEDLAIYLLEELLNQSYVGNVKLIVGATGQEYMDSYLEHYSEELALRSQYLAMEKEDLVEEIARLEFEAFDEVINEGGRAGCQDDWYTFRIMRTSQYLTWTKDMLVQYAVEFILAKRGGWNYIMEKYGRMEESTAPSEWEKMKDKFPVIPENKKAIIEQIVAVQVGWMESFAAQYPGMASNARRIHTSEDMPWDTSYETYLRGETSTYSDKLLHLYGQFIVEKVQSGQNLAYEIMLETVKQYGYQDLDDAAKKMQN